jgi:putative restriction endonuclease
VSSTKPFRLRIFSSERGGFTAAIYIWNCTHGGGAARAANEYRVQITGVVPEITKDDVTLLLGWHAGYEVFVAFDIQRHRGQKSKSPSIQIAEETLQAAHRKAFALHTRQNGEIAVAFRSEFLVDYALASRALHSTGKAAADFALLNDLEKLTDKDIDRLTDKNRRVVVARIARRYRAADFCRRVLGAYNSKCAMCGVQLKLVDAAHIIPVAARTSTDETKNGVALCKLHHAAFDSNLVSFDERYRVEVSNARSASLTDGHLGGGLRQFMAALRPALLLPNDRRDYPPPVYIREARSVRGWKG